jgi:hypothetical protein
VRRCLALVESYQSGDETVEEAEELARMVREDPARARFLFEAIMLEADLCEIFAGSSRIQDAPRVRRIRFTPRFVAACAVAVFMLAGLAVLLRLGAPTAARMPAPAPAAPAPQPAPREREDHGSRREEIEREYRKGLKEVERKRREGNEREADKKLREIEREREKQLGELERRKVDR